MTSAQPVCWVLTEGIAGTENQCRGLAEAMGLEPLIKRAQPTALWCAIPAGALLPPLGALTAGSDSLVPPWPDLLIAGGRKAIGLALRLRQAARCFTVFVQDPRTARSRFDVVVAPQHDGLEGGNVVTTRTALHRITQSRLDEARARFGPGLADLPRPLVAVLIGGASRRHRFDAGVATTLGRQLAAMAAASGAGLALTASRRTNPESMDALLDTLTTTPTRAWRGTGENPYFGYLAAADAIVVTTDSISMTSEACATGKPVYVASIPGRRSRRFERFFDGLAADGLALPFTGRIEDWSPRAPLNETARAAEAVMARFRARSDP